MKAHTTIHADIYKFKQIGINILTFEKMSKTFNAYYELLLIQKIKTNFFNNYRCLILDWIEQ